MKREYQHYYGSLRLDGGIFLARNERVEELFPGVKAKKAGDFDKMVGLPKGDRSTPFYPVTRIVAYNPRGSKHQCGHKCQTAKGPNCECSCGGENHGLMA